MQQVVCLLPGRCPVINFFPWETHFWMLLRLSLTANSGTAYYDCTFLSLHKKKGLHQPYILNLHSHGNTGGDLPEHQTSNTGRTHGRKQSISWKLSDFNSSAKLKSYITKSVTVLKSHCLPTHFLTQKSYFIMSHLLIIIFFPDSEPKYNLFASFFLAVSLFRYCIKCNMEERL